MLDNPQRGKRGPAPSWKLGSTRAIRVPIVLADALLNLARQIDNGEVTLVDAVLAEQGKQETRESVARSDDKTQTHEVTLVDAVLTEQGKQETRESIARSDDKTQTHEEQTKIRWALADSFAEVQVKLAEVQASLAQAQASFAKARTMFIRTHPNFAKISGSDGKSFRSTEVVGNKNQP